MFVKRGSNRSLSLVKGLGPNATFRRCTSPTRTDGLHRYVPRVFLLACHEAFRATGRELDSDFGFKLTRAGPNSLFIRILLDKKYALPYKTVDALVFHFIRLANSSRSKDGDDKLPVLWHQSLLVFVQRSVPLLAFSLQNRLFSYQY